MQGIKAHTHKDREKIVEELIPVIKNTYKDNFVALAGDGSFARNEDLDFSDLELVVFVKKPLQKDKTMRKIVGGILVVAVVETKESFIQKYLDVSDVWYASGAGKLLPLINKEFIEGINQFQSKDLEKKCLEQIQKRWPFYQEITAKVLNNVLKKDILALSMSFPAMVKEVLVLMSFLNSSPYKTLGTYIQQAKNFKLQPKGFNELIEFYLKTDFDDFEKIKNISEEVFSSFEKLLLGKGLVLYK